MNRRVWFRTIGAALLALCAPLRRLGSARSRGFAAIDMRYRMGHMSRAVGYEWYVDQNLVTQAGTLGMATTWVETTQTLTTRCIPNLGPVRALPNSRAA